MKLLQLLITELGILCFIVKKKLECMRIMLKQINNIWWSNFPLENAYFTQQKCFSILPILSKLSMETMQSVVPAKNQRFHFAKNIEVWTSDSVSGLITFKHFHEKKNRTVFERQFYIFVAFDVVPESVFCNFNVCTNSNSWLSSRESCSVCVLFQLLSFQSIKLLFVQL